MAALHYKLLIFLPLLFVINGIDAEPHFTHLPHFPQFPSFHPLGFDERDGNGRIIEGADFTSAEGFDPRPDRPEPHHGPTAGRAEPAVDLKHSRLDFHSNKKRAVRPKLDLPGFPGVPQPGKPAADVPSHDFPTLFTGAWQVVQLDSGVSAMHLNLLPNNKILMYDATAFRISNLKLPNGQCIPFTNDKGEQLTDCWSHAVEYDVQTNAVRPLKVLTDPWCSSGGLTADGRFISTGGWLDGTRSVRYFDACPTCDFRDLPDALAEPRWYSTQVTLPDGRFIIVGGRKAYSFEYVPREGQVNKQAIFFPMLDETTDLDENNLYPFVHLSTDGNLFILANRRSVLLNPQTNKVIKEFRVLGGGSRNYPASGMSALLPIDLSVPNPQLVPAEVIVCGGAKPEAYALAGKQKFIPALQDCARLRITDANPKWVKEKMPSRRVMGDLLILPTGDLLLINGAQLGVSAWTMAEQPNFTPVLYSPNKKPGNRFKNLQPTLIARMYHSTSALLPNGKILVAGSNTNPGYQFQAKYPTEMRVEHFSPPYLDPALAIHRPAIMDKNSDIKLKYGKPFNVQFQLQDNPVAIADIKVTMYAPPFTTHGFSMNQRLVILGKNDLKNVARGVYKLQVVAPRSSVFAPPGYYLLFVAYRGVPSVGIWVQIL
ncbi:hypothetical protein TB2_025882 [Malus domestica]|uniref:aldehyde oxidase GLOX1-like n=1 Tax=Malus domestica TaxID=3750 RepID=UPI0010AB0D6C|nr:aldehyde oxidase GLOX1-like [Malus domestica]